MPKSTKNKKNTSGAKRQKKLIIDKIKFWAFLLFVLGMIVFVAIGKVQIESRTLLDNFYAKTAKKGFKFNNLVISSIKNTPKDAVLASVKVKPGTPLLAVNIKEIQENVKKIDWVKTAIVERKFPDTIYIGVLERKPIAIWQNNYKMHLITEDGVIIATDDIQAFNHLLLVVGSDAHLYARKLIEDINKNPGLVKYVISATRYGERRWNLILSENITVKMPETDFNRAWNYLNKLYKHNKLFGQNYKVIDLRDSHKYYVEKHD